jgi:hypothetical protein
VDGVEFRIVTIESNNDENDALEEAEDIALLGGSELIYFRLVPFADRAESKWLERGEEATEALATAIAPGRPINEQLSFLVVHQNDKIQ